MNTTTVNKSIEMLLVLINENNKYVLLIIKKSLTCTIKSLTESIKIFPS